MLHQGEAVLPKPWRNPSAMGVLGRAAATRRAQLRLCECERARCASVKRIFAQSANHGRWQAPRGNILGVAAGEQHLYPGVSTLPGQDIEVERSYIWKTFVQEALSGKQSTVSARQYALVNFKLTYNLLRDNIAPSEIKTIAACTTTCEPLRHVLVY